MRFRDRGDAGRQLAGRLVSLQLHDPLIFALPRGGVPVACELAAALDAPVDVLVARKIGAPGHPEFGIGAIAEGAEVVADQAVLKMLGITSRHFDQLAAQERVELERRISEYRCGRALPSMEGRDIVVVDDGMATGVTAEAAVRSLRRVGARRVILAVPACASDAARRLALVADLVVCLIEPEDFVAVGLWYKDFTQTSDDDVVRLLERSRQRADAEPSS